MLVASLLGWGAPPPGYHCGTVYVLRMISFAVIASAASLMATALLSTALVLRASIPRALFSLTPVPALAIALGLSLLWIGYQLHLTVE